jgi:hypothetical protein
LVETCEWVVVENFRILIGWEEAGGVVTGQSKAGLSEVVRFRRRRTQRAWPLQQR